MHHDSTLIKHVQIMTPDGLREGDVLLKNGKIAAVDWALPDHADLIIREKGLTLIPGVIDPHVHFREPGVEWKEDLESGSRAAVAGGVTTFFDMPNTKPATVTAELIWKKKELAAKKSIANYNFYIGATTDNLEEINNVENVPGIKIFVGSSTGSLLVDRQDDLHRIFSNGKRLIAVHSEEENMVRANKEKYAASTDVKDHLNIRTTEAAVTCTRRLLKLALDTGRRLHICHLTTAEEAELIREVKKTSSLVTTEVSPQHLFLWAPDVYDKLGNYAQINPPIREKRHADALWKALKNGVIDLIATDHAPHTVEEKEQPFGKAPSGMPGVETSLLLMLDMVNRKKCTLEEITRWMSVAPADIFNIKDKGRIIPGYDADLVLVDMNGSKTIKPETFQSKAKWSAFAGRTVKGVPVATFVNGNIVYREGDIFDAVKGREVIINDR